MSNQKSPIQVGFEAAEKMTGSDGSSEFLKIKAGEAITLCPMIGLDRLISINQVAIWNTPSGQPAIFPSLKGTGTVCPGEQLSKKASYRGFLPVLVKDENDNWSPMIYAFGVSVLKMFANIENDADGIEGTVIVLRREGESLKTKYSLTPTAKKAPDISSFEMPDIISKLQPTTREGILQLLAKCGIDVSEILLDGEEAPAVEESASEDEKWSDA